MAKSAMAAAPFRTYRLLPIARRELSMAACEGVAGGVKRMTKKVTKQKPSRSIGRYRRGMRVYRERRLRAVGVRKKRGAEAPAAEAPDRLIRGLPRADWADATLDKGKKGDERNVEIGWPLGVEGGELSSEIVDGEATGATRSAW